ncbi:MAG: gliding motility-associated ABC transporter permease subunit GldF [Saprospiraceae bacterium]|nr:gliding motility-associated ABC transporter permease subunit GldF [Saprospiraceae bacterium]
MYSIFKKEVNLFLSSLIGYATISVFLLLTGLFMWVFPDYSVITYGYASLDSFFGMAPYIFLFLIPAITMRAFSEEIQTGTIELLVTRPLSQWEILLGKYLACVFLVTLSILPTFLYFYSVYQLGDPVGNIDVGATVGSYIGLVSLGAVFVAIGIFASSLTSNQIIAFITSFFLCAFFYEAFGSLSRLELFFGTLDTIIESIGIKYHYRSISRGLVDTRDLVYFLSMIIVFLVSTNAVLQQRR